MTRRQLFRSVLVLIILGVVLGLGAGRYADAETRQTYLLAVVVLYTMALVVVVLAAILIRVYPGVNGLLERYLKREPAPLDVPDEVKSLIEAVRAGRRNSREFEKSLRPRLDALAGEEITCRRVAAWFRKGPSIKELNAMIDSIEEK